MDSRYRRLRVSTMKRSSLQSNTRPPFVCDLPNKDEEAQQCGKEFRTYKALAAHIRARHGEASKYYLYTVTNQCPFCMTVFATKNIAAWHVKKACTHPKGTCRPDRAWWMWPLKTPRSLKCTTCEDIEFGTLEELQWHIRTQHLSPPVYLMMQATSGDPSVYEYRYRRRHEREWHQAHVVESKPARSGRQKSKGSGNRRIGATAKDRKRTSSVGGEACRRKSSRQRQKTTGRGKMTSSKS